MGFFGSSGQGLRSSGESGADALPGGRDRPGPAPGGVDAQPQLAGASGDAGRDVQDPVAQGVDLAAGELRGVGESDERAFGRPLRRLPTIGPVRSARRVRQRIGVCFLFSEPKREGWSVSSKAPIGTRLLWHAMDLLHLGLPYQVRHLHRFDRQEFQVKVKGVGELTLRPKSADSAVVSQVFSFLQYDLSDFPQKDVIEKYYLDILARGRTPLIVDLGANNGVAARWFLKQYPRAHIVAVEPDAENARMCRLNTDGYSVEVLQAAAGSAPGKVELDTSSDNSVSFTTARVADGGVDIVTLPQIIADHADDHELFIVKIDIEGFEDDLFSANTEWVKDAFVIMIEPHDQKFPHRTTSSTLQATMGGLGFQILISGENLVYVRPN